MAGVILREETTTVTPTAIKGWATSLLVALVVLACNRATPFDTRRIGSGAAPCTGPPFRAASRRRWRAVA
jgi:hypothetical protein